MRPAPVLWLDETDSTNAEARRRALSGEFGPVWIATHRQTAGRGRRGRAWETASGNLAATLLFTADRPPAQLAELAFVAALAAADLASLYVEPRRVSFKWPNDPLLDGRKLGGVLIETGPHPAGGLWVAVGIGVNLASAPSLALYPATSLAEHMAGPPPSAEEALGNLAMAFARSQALWEAHGFPAIAALWRERASGLGEACTVRLPNETLQGLAQDLEDDGALRLVLADGSVRKITAGDVFPGSN